MSAHELRAEARIAATQRGRLSAGDTWFPCMILDMSGSGFRLVSNKHLPVGQTLEFRCELYPGKSLECFIEVMNSDDDSAGMMITEIDDNAAKLLHTFLEERFAVKLATPKPRRQEEQ